MKKALLSYSISSLLFFIPIAGICQPQPQKSPPQLQLTYLGTAGWEITNGQTVILIDPYYSRLRRSGQDSAYLVNAKVIKDTRKAFKRTDVITPDTNIIKKYLKKTDYILVHHTHTDHVLDVPYIALKTGAIVIGNENTANLMYASGLQEQQMITVKGGEDYDFGDFSVRVIPTLHSPLMQKRYYDAQVIPKTIKTPLRLDDYVEGGCLSFLVRIGGYQILTSGSMNYIERELSGIKPDIAIIGAAPSRKEIYKYEERLMRVLNYPATVLPTHWDNFTIPFEASEEDQIAQLKAFQQTIKTLSPKTSVIIPNYFEAVSFPLKTIK